ncbi:MAG TPA: HAMP domain-containing protein [Gemmatimonadaceae bacterium]|nr:HAMP domain-containing protein [Gemmatimonadaceae bacterium]
MSDPRTEGEAALDTKLTGKVAHDVANGKRNRRRTLTRLLDGLRALEAGDFRARLSPEDDPLLAEVVDVFNSVASRHERLSEEMRRVSFAVGREGNMRERVAFPASGSWSVTVDAVNNLITDLVQPTTEVSRVIKAVAEGDLSQKVDLEIEGKTVQGEFFRIGSTVNRMVDQLRAFSSEVTRVAKEVGTEGVLGGQANVPGVAGTWKDLTDNVNGLANNLTSQVRNIALVTTAVANGDLSQKITVEAKGEVRELKQTINTMVDQLNAFASEVTRVAGEVGTEGKLGGQARVEGVLGTWRDLTENVNGMAANLTVQLRDVSAVATAIASGDLTRKITVEAMGEILQVKEVINKMVDQLNAFAGEVIRVAREVGTEGVLGGQANVPGVAGTWKSLTDNVNLMANNLTGQVRNIADVTTAVAKGDLTRTITVEAKGEVLALKNTVNTMVDQLSAFASEVTRVAREVGTEGILGGQASVQGVSGTWKDLTDNVNFMASNLTTQVRNIADVSTAVARGDLSRKITVEVRGEILELKNVFNTMVDQLNAFAGEVTRVAREVGTEGKLGGQAKVTGAGGVWRDLTDNVNGLASNLTTQVRNIAFVMTAVANGDLSQKISVEVQGEVLELKNTINNMVEKLRIFADEVTRVSREVGTEGKLGGQAQVPDVAGTWKGLTDSVNAMANSLTMQVRNIADVATSVTKGDLTRQITVDAQGELDELKTNINQMIGNLRETTERNEEQDWLKTNLAKFSRMMQGQKDLESVSRLIMSELTPLVSAHHGAFFIADTDATEGASLRLIASYAYRARKHVATRFLPGEGLVGQAALEKQPILLQNVPDDYIQITSGLGEAAPRNIVVLPILFEGDVKAVIELASFLPFSTIHQTFLDQLAESIGVVLNMIQANMRTEELLEQSQQLTQELQSQSQELRKQQDELKKSNTELEQQARSLRQSEELLKEQQEELQQVNEELEEKASLLAEQNQKVEQKNREVESARQALEEKAQQLATSSKYKSEFLANMSHELRTPLNSLLILARLLSDNKEKSLTAKQVEYARTIHSSGTDLLNLINDILDLSKVEAGKMEIHLSEVALSGVVGFANRTFRPVAEQKRLAFDVIVGEDAPRVLYTDGQRLQQILKNLLSNAIKFTDSGSVRLRVRRADPERKFTSPILERTKDVVAFEVTDTGIGIAQDKQKLIFEPFLQADGTTSRRFGGTGLGLSISRDIARALGGELSVESAPDKGSTFTLFMPVRGGSTPMMDRTFEPGPATGAQVPSAAPHSARGTATGVPSWSDAFRESLGHVGTGDEEEEPPPASDAYDDDRETIAPGDRVILVIEHDMEFAQRLYDIARHHGFKCLVSLDGEAGMRLAHAFQPDAITLELGLNGVDGWTVLDRLKHHPDTRHIPVHVISSVGDRHAGLSAGAIGYLEKPASHAALDGAFRAIETFVNQPHKRVLLLADEESRRTDAESIAQDDVEIVNVASAAEAHTELTKDGVDAIVLDVGPTGPAEAFAILETVRDTASVREVPIVVRRGGGWSADDEARLHAFAESLLLREARSAEQLLDATAQVLHRTVNRLPERQRQVLQRLHESGNEFTGKRVLIVDDDVRNVFSLTSVLEDQGMQVDFVENGLDAISKLHRTSYDLVLMDIMMPEMDGYTATRTIRDDQRLKSLPIIALTAKAMKGDRERCLAAGASDYITKPVDTGQLLNLMRVWMHR